jgi:N-methylhydantoinase B
MKRDLVTLQLISNSLLYASEEMGLALRNSAYSPNIKERMDHSAAIFDSDSRLLAQAEHIPVHLGSLPWGLRNLVDRCEKEGILLEEGSMVVSNDPYITGTHLNDVTVAAPIHHKRRLVAFAVNKAHHSDVGGKSPGSISMEARTLDEEGVIISPAYLWRNRSFVESTVEGLARASRTPGERRGDLKAQLAANIAGGRRVGDLISKYGIDAFLEAGPQSFRDSETMMKMRISRFHRGTYRASDFLEGPGGSDLTLRASVTVSASGVEVDYSGTGLQVDYPLNAVFGVTLSGVYFVLRSLTGDDIPANHGAFSPIRVNAPEGSLLNPTSPHPVGGGNVETSQRNADLVFRALSQSARGLVPAASGGSMNNVMMGGRWKGSKWAFYETNGVGLGASRELDGIDGIQSNMTNTMNTPIEEMERSLPILMTKYEFRPDSSGAGARRGGSGLIRAYRMLSDQTTFTVLADRERHLPWGLHGGRPGRGTEVFVRQKGRLSRVPSKSTLDLSQGDEVELRTAGGGGFGDPKERAEQGILHDIEGGLLTRRQAFLEYGFRARTT